MQIAGDRTRENLIRIISQNDQNILEDSKKIKNLLLDLNRGEEKKEVTIICNSLEARIPFDLIKNKNNLPYKVSAERCVQHLQNISGITEELAMWTVDSWAIALKIISINDITNKKINQKENNPVIPPQKRINKQTQSKIQFPVIPKNPKYFLKWKFNLVIVILGLAIIIGALLLIPSINNTLRQITSPSPQQTVSPTQFEGNTVVTQQPNTETSTIPESSSLTTFATFSGQSSLTTNNINIPSYYWELWYTADPMVTGGQGETSAVGSNSAVFPTLSIKVMDGDLPNQVIDTVEPPGGLDITLWKRSGIDPRPWVEKFYEGHKNYYFIINANHLYSYTIEIRIPKNS
jgi:hypothetical protein